MINNSPKTNNCFEKNEPIDGRLKHLWQLEAYYKLLYKVTGLLIVSFSIVLLLAGITKAQDLSSMFMVPTVSMTPRGIAVTQPQTGDGYNFLNNRETATAVLEDGTSYKPPRYDAFADGSANMTVKIPEPTISTAQVVDFTARNDLSGSQDGFAGTTKTTFSFLAEVKGNSSLVGTNSGEFEYRWDFNNDGKEDTYFSHLPNVNHQYKQAGNYQVKLEVLDKAGNVSKVIKYVTVVANDAPNAVFTVDKISAPVNKVFSFDTSLSSDNQYSRYNLQYRFDWDSDGNWDTNFQNKNNWNHLFRQQGNYTVTMQVIDPEGATAMAALDISVEEDNAPTARMMIEKVKTTLIGINSFNFDASQSSDDQTPNSKLKYRWDFNYTGKDDINFDTNWSTSAKYTGSYKIGGSKTVRLQVMDEQGQVDQDTARIEVPWTESYLKMAIGMGR